MAEELQQRYGKSYYPREVDRFNKSGRQKRGIQRTGREDQGPRTDLDKRYLEKRDGGQTEEPRREQRGRFRNEKVGTATSHRPVPGRRLDGTEKRRLSKNITEFVRKLNGLTRELAEFTERTF